MRILYVGDSSPASTSKHRADALVRLGHEITHLDPYRALAVHLRGVPGMFHYRTGYALLNRQVMQWLSDALCPLSPQDLCWVDSGVLLGKEAVEQLRLFAGKVVLFNHDDPTGHRDGARFNTLLTGLSIYDLCVVVRPFNVDEFKCRGAREVIRTYMSYDEVRHAPTADTPSVPPQFDNDIVFIGRNMNGEGRDHVLLTLIQAGLKPAIWGDNWQRSSVWPALAPYWRGGSISGSDYVDAIRHARICLGMLSKGNRDQHTTRSMEIPYAGGLLCAERTAEHEALYTDGEEAVFWRTPEECVALCQALLADPGRVARIKAAGRARAIRNQVGNEDLCRRALARLGELSARPPVRPVFVFDGQPVRYKALVYQAIERLRPGLFEVIYASDSSVKGYRDAECGGHLAWDTPLMEGYSHRVLGNERPERAGTPALYHGRGVWSLLRRERPAAVMLTQSHYHFDHAAFFSAWALRIPILIRQETQDQTYAFQRSRLKSILRALLYRAYYASARHCFVFGKLNEAHLLAHGVPAQRMSFARFSVPDPLAAWSTSRKREVAAQQRRSLGIAEGKQVLGFFGKLIAKKHPDLIFDALSHLPPQVLQNLELVFVGAGELDPMLRERAAQALAEHGVRTHFLGFVNQTQLPPCYLMVDVMALPSRHQGEAWGLVVNEALQAGCGVAITEGVGCHVEFGALPRVRVSAVEDARGLACALVDLLAQPRDFEWARPFMQAYSTEEAAQSLRHVFEGCVS